MKPADAIKWIRNTFNNPSESFKLYSSISEERFLEVLCAIEKRLPPSSGPTGISIRQFLYCGCLKFNRWNTPTPYVLNRDSRVYFDRFVSSLQVSEPDTINTAKFIVDQILWDLYLLLDRKPLNNAQMIEKEINLIESKLKAIIPPQSPNKLEEFDKQYSKCEAIINGAYNNDLTTIIKTRLPVNPVREPYVITTHWNSIEAKVLLTPNWVEPQNSFVQGENLVAIPVSSSQWQHGYCDVIITVKTLLDPAKGKTPLAATPNQETPFQEWPSIFIDTFNIIDSIVWKLREEQTVPGKWILYPNDIAATECTIKNNNCVIDWILKGPPGSVEYTNKKPETKELQINITQKTEWHIRCKILAETFLNSGEINEALFWLNVGIEAFFDKRTREICASHSIDHELLSSGKAYWERAEEVVVNQCPELANKIKWPESAVGSSSWYTKIRFLNNKVPLKENHSLILSKYRDINKHRNTLFHGVEEVDMNITTALEALAAFNWLEDNFI